MRFALGFSFADIAAPYALHRENPVYHPRFSWLTASTVSFSSIAPEPNDEATGTFVPGAFPNDSVPVAQYQKIWATVRFTDKPWTFLENEDIDSYVDEPTRNTFYNPSPSVEIISAEGLNNIVWANNPALIGEPIPAPFGTLMSKCNLQLRWMWVPNEYISGPDSLTFTPLWINDAVGRVNADEFLGYPPRTLLLQAPQYERFRFPVMTSEGIFGFFGWNITFPMQFFDPDRDPALGTLTTRTDDNTGVITLTSGTAAQYGISPASTINLVWATGSRTGMSVTGVAGNVVNLDVGSGDALPIVTTGITAFDERYRGHQLVPFRNNLLWYGVQRVDGQSLYPEATFANIFRHVGEYS